MKEFWDNRYTACDTFYGDEPNLFFKHFIDTQPLGRILLPGEGEGRNAIYAAKNGWGVEAFDFSEIARKNAADKAEIAGVMLHYELKDVADFKVGKLYDVIALVYLHLPKALRVSFHKQLTESLKPGGYIIMEAFSTKQAYNLTGGPEDTSVLYSAKEIQNDFEGLDILQCEEKEIELQEGDEHRGHANVIHFIGQKR
jgi:cyclopropane fatty-acyl-phospholipid synthase-like methyltransferase